MPRTGTRERLVVRQIRDDELLVDVPEARCGGGCGPVRCDRGARGNEQTEREENDAEAS
jgi:hypothetical protein